MWRCGRGSSSQLESDVNDSWCMCRTYTNCTSEISAGRLKRKGWEWLKQKRFRSTKHLSARELSFHDVLHGFRSRKG